MWEVDSEGESLIMCESEIGGGRELDREYERYDRE